MVYSQYIIDAFTIESLLRMNKSIICQNDSAIRWFEIWRCTELLIFVSNKMLHNRIHPRKI